LIIIVLINNIRSLYRPELFIKKLKKQETMNISVKC